MQKEKIKIPCKECIAYAACKHNQYVICDALHDYLHKMPSEDTWLNFTSFFPVTKNPRYVNYDNTILYSTLIFFISYSDKDGEFLTVLKDGPDEGMRVLYSGVETDAEILIWNWFQQSGTNPFWQEK